MPAGRHVFSHPMTSSRLRCDSGRGQADRICCTLCPGSNTVPCRTLRRGFTFIRRRLGVPLFVKPGRMYGSHMLAPCPLRTLHVR